ncbi:hypothetical protein [Variovorax sp. RA8]|uniref:hypothetical protein n=1 Tax=Variovorax sp. (strain JCM 16519 / RA8) TaxID=662548 RepID=UPI000A49F345|nr:hypothetical protein [Variovorax sp. RA8]VTU34199.1 hypothetical protein RA8CHR_04925 [Variovorax sp. RA8]
MWLDFLRRIENATFPLTVTDQQEIEGVEQLMAALLITAAVAPLSVGKETRGQRSPAIVIGITGEGRKLLAKYRSRSVSE